MELSINEEKYLKKIIIKYPKKKIYKLIKKKHNLEISNDLKSLLTKMENENFMDNYYEDMIGGMNFLNSPNNPFKGPNPPAQAGKQTGIANFQMPIFKNPFNRSQGATAATVPVAQAGIANARARIAPVVRNFKKNMTHGAANLAANAKTRMKEGIMPEQGATAATGTVAQAGIPNAREVTARIAPVVENLKKNMTHGAANFAANAEAGVTQGIQSAQGAIANSLDQLNPESIYENLKQEVSNFVDQIEKNIGLSADLSYDNRYVSNAVETYLSNFVGVPSPFNKLLGRFYFDFVIKPYIQTKLVNKPIRYNEQNFVNSPISDMYNNNINSYAPHMYYPINYNSIEKYPMDNHDGYYN